MATSIEDELARRENSRRARIEIRGAALIAEPRARHRLRGADGAPGRTRGRQV